MPVLLLIVRGAAQCFWHLCLCMHPAGYSDQLRLRPEVLDADVNFSLPPDQVCVGVLRCLFGVRVRILCCLFMVCVCVHAWLCFRVNAGKGTMKGMNTHTHVRAHPPLRHALRVRTWHTICSQTWP